MRKISAMYEHRSILLIYESFLRINEEKKKIPEEKWIKGMNEQLTKKNTNEQNTYEKKI